MAILPHTVTMPTGGEFTIYGETANINYFINGDLEPDTVDGPVDAQVSVGSHTRRQYPGDASTINVSGAQREFVKDPSRGGGSALPGKSMILRELDGNKEKRQFTYKGDWSDVTAFLRSEAAFTMFAYNHTGRNSRITVPAATAP